MIHLRRIPISHKDGKNTASVAFEYKNTSYIVDAENDGNTVYATLKSEGKELYKTLNSAIEYTTSQAVNKTVNEFFNPEKAQGKSRGKFLGWVRSLQS